MGRGYVLWPRPRTVGGGDVPASGDVQKLSPRVPNSPCTPSAMHAVRSARRVGGKTGARMGCERVVRHAVVRVVRGAGLVSTAADYYEFATMLCNGGVGTSGTRLLRADTAALLASDQLGHLLAHGPSGRVHGPSGPALASFVPAGVARRMGLRGCTFGLGVGVLEQPYPDGFGNAGEYVRTLLLATTTPATTTPTTQTQAQPRSCARPCHAPSASADRDCRPVPCAPCLTVPGHALTWGRRAAAGTGGAVLVGPCSWWTLWSGSWWSS